VHLIMHETGGKGISLKERVRSCVQKY